MGGERTFLRPGGSFRRVQRSEQYHAELLPRACLLGRARQHTFAVQKQPRILPEANLAADIGNDRLSHGAHKYLHSHRVSGFIPLRT